MSVRWNLEIFLTECKLNKHLEKKNMKKMVNEKTWKEFQDTGLLWWINMILHTFGWAICLEVEDGEVIGAFSARVQFRGFDLKSNSEGYVKVSKYMEENIEELLDEAKH